MFEEEAEEYAENREVCGLLDAISENLQNYDYGIVAHYNIDPLVEECFKDGAEFGYNKANEWHYVKGGDLPKEFDKPYLCYVNGHFEVGYFMAYKEQPWHFDEYYLDNEDVDAWKEIVFPKEIEE